MFYLRHRLSLQILKSLETWERCVVVPIRIMKAFIWSVDSWENIPNAVCFCFFLSEAFLPWLRADPGLPTEPCSGVRQRWKHLCQWVHPVCWETVSTHSCSSSHTFSTIPISADFHVANVDLIGGEQFIWFGKEKSTNWCLFFYRATKTDILIVKDESCWGTMVMTSLPGWPIGICLARMIPVVQ